MVALQAAGVNDPFGLISAFGLIALAEGTVFDRVQAARHRLERA
jgi:hypothetical protein